MSEETAVSDDQAIVNVRTAGSAAGASTARLLTKKQAGEVLSVCERTVGTLIASGKLKAVYLSKRAVRIDPADLGAFVQASKG